MPTIGLSQIVKNEEHVIERMLLSIKDIVDYITIVDTGSTDNTKQKIEDFCNKYNIPFTIGEKEFDDFASCRNYALELADNKTDYSFFLDADEVLMFNNFDKSNLTKDIYLVTTHYNNKTYNRVQFWKNKKGFRWNGVLHEHLDFDKEKNTYGVLPNVACKVRSDGHSWTTDVAQKYYNHAKTLESYVIEKERTPREVFYLAQSYCDSARVKNNYFENEERLRRALYYYNERITMTGGNNEEVYLSQLKVADIKKRLGESFLDIKEHLLKAHDMDMLRGEAISYIIDHYQQHRDFKKSLIYAEYGYNNYHKNNPYPLRSLHIDFSLYEWKFLKMYMNSCYYTGKIEKAKQLLKELKIIINNSPQYFSKTDIEKINQNEKVIM